MDRVERQKVVISSVLGNDIALNLLCIKDAKIEKLEFFKGLNYYYDDGWFYDYAGGTMGMVKSYTPENFPNIFKIKDLIPKWVSYWIELSGGLEAVAQTLNINIDKLKGNNQ